MGLWVACRSPTVGEGNPALCLWRDTWRGRYVASLGLRGVCRSAETQAAPDHADQLVGLDGFVQILGRSRVHGCEVAVNLAVGGEDDHWNRASSLANSLEKAEAVAIWQPQITDYHVEGFVSKNLTSFTRSRGSTDLEVLAGQDATQDPQEIRVIIDNEDPACNLIGHRVLPVRSHLLKPAG